LAILVAKTEFRVDHLVGACRVAKVLQDIIPIVGVQSFGPTSHSGRLNEI